MYDLCAVLAHGLISSFQYFLKYAKTIIFPFLGLPGPSFCAVCELLIISLFFLSVFAGKLLNDHLQEQAKQVYGESDKFRGEKVGFVPSQLSVGLKAKSVGMDTEENTYRKEFQDDITYKQLFVEVQRQVQKIPAKGTNAEAIKQFSERHGNLVFISGPPGIGKTALTKHIVKEMWEKSLYGAEIVFYIRFREIDYEGKTDLLGFLAPSFTDNTNRSCLLEKLQNTDNIFIVMDGLDEATSYIKMKQPKISTIFKQATAESFIQNILAGNILPKSKKIITSRPYQFADLPEDLQPLVVFRLQGLNESTIKRICFSIVFDDMQCTLMIKFMSKGDQSCLKNFCSIPFVAIAVIERLKEFAEVDESLQNRDDFSVTNTGIMIFILKELVLKKLKENNIKFQIKQLSTMAFQEFQKEKLFFRKHILEQARIDPHHKVFFDVMSDKDNSNISFVHPMWQEFFVAVKLRLFTEKTEFKNFVTNLAKIRYTMVRKFLFGLCSERNLDNLLDFVIDHTELNTENDRENYVIVLKKFVEAQIDQISAKAKREKLSGTNDKKHNNELFKMIKELIGEMEDTNFLLHIMDLWSRKV